MFSVFFLNFAADSTIFMTMKYLVSFILAVLLLSSCGDKNNSKATPVTSDKEIAVETDSPEISKENRQNKEYLISRVKQIYKDVFQYYNDSIDNESIPQNSPDENYCTKGWNTILAKVSEFDQIHNPDDIGFFDADYWVMGNDYMDLSVSDIEVVSFEKDKAKVELNLHNCGSITRVRLDMKFVNGNWFIDNFIDVSNDIDWKKEMEDYVK